MAIKPSAASVMTKFGFVPSDKVDRASLEGVNHLVVEALADYRIKPPQDARQAAFMAALALIERCMEAGFIPVGGMTDGGHDGVFRQSMTRPR